MAARRRRRASAEERIVEQVVSQAMRTRQGRVALIVCAIIALLCFAGYWLWENNLRPRHPVGPVVRLATWNLRQFSEDRKPLDLRAVADVITANHFYLVAIQEV